MLAVYGSGSGSQISAQTATEIAVHTFVQLRLFVIMTKDR